MSEANRYKAVATLYHAYLTGLIEPAVAAWERTFAPATRRLAWPDWA